jgi:ketosteroid isomerase-like protein
MNLEELLNKEKTLWSGGAPEYRRTLDGECLIAFTAMAGVQAREDVAAMVGRAERWRDIDIEVEGSLQPTEDVSIFTYRVTAVRGDEPYRARVSSGYVKRDDDWRMMFHQQTPLGTASAPTDSEERRIRNVLAKFTRAIHDKDAQGAIAQLADDEVTFDLSPPLRMGPDVTHDPASLEEWFDTWRGPIESDTHDLAVAVDGNVGYAFGLQHMTGNKNDGAQVDLWFRATACFKRANGEWRIAHMHNSVPFAMDGSARALLDLEPAQS